MQPAWSSCSPIGAHCNCSNNSAVQMSSPQMICLRDMLQKQKGTKPQLAPLGQLVGQQKLMWAVVAVTRFIAGFFGLAIIALMNDTLFFLYSLLLFILFCCCCCCSFIQLASFTWSTQINSRLMFFNCSAFAKYRWQLGGILGIVNCTRPKEFWPQSMTQIASVIRNTAEVFLQSHYMQW